MLQFHALLKYIHISVNIWFIRLKPFLAIQLILMSVIFYNSYDQKFFIIAYLLNESKKIL